MKKKVPFRRVEKLEVARSTCQQLGCHLFGSADEFENLGGQGVPEAVGFDFNREFGVVVCRGECRTGGYGIEVKGAWSRERTLVIDVELRDPPPGAFVTLAMTYPREIIVISRRHFDGLPGQVELHAGRSEDVGG